MGATPQYGSMVFIGNSSGKTYAVDLYISDVNGGLVNFDGGAGAGAASPTQWIAPEKVTLIDYSMVTGTADTEKIRLTVNNRPLASILRYGVHLTTLATRPKLNIGFMAGAQIGGIQISD